MAGKKATLDAQGFIVGGGKRQIAGRVSQPMYDELKMRAIQEGRSIQSQIADYIHVGLEVDRDWDEDEPDRHASDKADQPLSKPVSGWVKDEHGNLSRMKEGK